MRKIVPMTLAILFSVVCSFQGFAQETEGGAGDGDRTFSNPVMFWELASNDADKSVEFFRNVFDWEITFDERIGFYTVSTGTVSQKVDGYIFTLSRAKLPFVAVYILVDDIDEKVKIIEKYGGLVLDPPKVFVEGGPQVCLFNDPSGATFAMFQTPQPK